MRELIIALPAGSATWGDYSANLWAYDLITPVTLGCDDQVASLVCFAVAAYSVDDRGMYSGIHVRLGHLS